MTTINQHPPQKPSLIDPQALMSIRNLEMRARVVVEGFWNGIHRSPYHGFSAEFTEYRQYTPDDDPRYLDWRVFARSDRYFIKKFEDETNVRCYLLVDRSASMSYGSGGFSKAEYSATLAATLGYFLYHQGDAVGLLTFDQSVREFLPARHRTGHLRQVMLALEQDAGGKATDVGGSLRRVTEIIHKRSLLLVVSDFLAPLEPLSRELAALAACGHEIAVFQVLDPTELRFEFSRPAMFQDVESDRILFIDPASARNEYLRNLEAHCEALRRSCQQNGAEFQRVSSDQPLELVLFDFLRRRMRRRRSAKVG